MSMLRDPSTKYSPFPQVPLTDRQWPTRTITAPPRWLSTDLRDGNQAIVDPMDAHKKTRFFDLLVEVADKPPDALQQQRALGSNLLREQRT